ncbi:MAG: nitroreductase family deazaflavin-dependent oxidoreductase [Gammaproteobacteria bacterium]|nr:nitroreductase family deazaflavin-dependent oxidoreductase [Gammaproteobacteria bacterium]
MSDSTLPNWIEEHVRQYMETNGEKGHIWNGMPTLLLTTQGRKSDMSRTIPLIYGTHEGSYVVVGSKGGHPHHPSWYLNLDKNPSVKVQVGSKHMNGVARTSSGEERQNLWNQMCQVFSGYTEYANKTDREIPVVVIDCC